MSYTVQQIERQMSEGRGEKTSQEGGVLAGDGHVPSFCRVQTAEPGRKMTWMGCRLQSRRPAAPPCRLARSALLSCSALSEYPRAFQLANYSDSSNRLAAQLACCPCLTTWPSRQPADLRAVSGRVESGPCRAGSGRVESGRVGAGRGCAVPDGARGTRRPSVSCVREQVFLPSVGPARLQTRDRTGRDQSGIRRSVLTSYRIIDLCVSVSSTGRKVGGGGGGGVAASGLLAAPLHFLPELIQSMWLENLHVFWSGRFPLINKASKHVSGLFI